MPRGDGTGPMGMGPMGRGRGGCMTGNRGFGGGMGCGFVGRGRFTDPQTMESQAELLQQPAERLRSQAHAMRQGKTQE